MENVRFDEMKSIIVKHEDVNGVVNFEYITLKEFFRSFVKERWNGERRYNKQDTIYGFYHTKMTVRNGDMISRRWFDFPKNDEEAETRHKKYLLGLDK